MQAVVFHFSLDEVYSGFNAVGFFHPSGHELGSFLLHDIYSRWNERFLAVIGTHEFWNNFRVFVDCNGPEVVPAHELAVSDLKNSKAYQFSFAPRGNIVSVISIKSLNNILLLENIKGTKAIPESCCLLKIQVSGRFLHC